MKEDGVSFVIVLWLEKREAPGQPEWRWRVTRVQTGETVYFRQLGDVLAYINKDTGVAPPR